MLFVRLNKLLPTIIKMQLMISVIQHNNYIILLYLSNCLYLVKLLRHNLIVVNQLHLFLI